MFGDDNFFSKIAATSTERVHSAVFAWIINGDFLTSKQKVKILKLFFKGVKNKYKKIACVNEWDNIDIYIEAGEDIFLIENKIKSIEHSGQLKKYNKETKSKSNAFLTLFGEKPTEKGWRSVSYLKFYNLLKEFKFHNPENFSEHTFNEYLDCLGGLTSIVEKFKKDHRQFPNLFIDGSVSNKEKAERTKSKYYKNDWEQYVAVNNLETIFQQGFWRMIGQKLGYKNWHVEETRGSGLLQINIKKCPRKIALWFGLQFQGEAIKINLAAEEYNKSKQDDLPKGIKDKFQKAANNLKEKYGECKISVGKPRSKAYISISIRRPKEKRFSQSFEDIIKSCQRDYKLAKEVIKELQ